MEIRWPHFRLTHDPRTGETVTWYPDGTRSGCGTVPEDTYHALKLGISPARHRLAHEVCHHLVAVVIGFDTSRVVWDDAHGLPQGPEAWREEWHTTALTYYVYSRLGSADPVGNYLHALIDLRDAGVDVDALREHARGLLGET